MGLNNRMEELIDLFIEVPPQLLVVAVLDSVKSSLYQAIDSSLGRRRERMNKKPPCGGLRGLDGDAVKTKKYVFASAHSANYFNFVCYLETLVPSMTIILWQQGLQSRITDIKQQMQQLKHMDSEIIDRIKTFEIEAGISSSSKSRDIVGQDDGMEELLDLLIEGPPQFSLVAILDSIGLDKTAFAREAYNSSYVKHYFDCHAWISEPYSNDADDAD
ncbi:hypothetical protein WN944_001515 [Citrus x changshan-huyou]|uniref:Uncharacterized protein n=1 Tax=Citrus x changshan-huyou TaxID=2935761 RepID=A0AAP0ML21_9ROSI